MNKESASSGGVGFTGILLVLFIALKLTHQIGWSWLWVLSPAWIGLAIGVVAVVLMLIIAIIGAAVDDRRLARIRVECAKRGRS